MEIDITSFFENAEPWKFSHSIAEGGPSAGSDTWRTALSEAAEAPLLKTPEALDALRGWARSSGGWEKDEIDAWSADECNALFIQLVSGDMREAGLDEQFADEIDWTDYDRRAEAGQIAGTIFKSGEAIYYSLSD
jgi:hypothetical protein